MVNQAVRLRKVKDNIEVPLFLQRVLFSLSCSQGVLPFILSFFVSIDAIQKVIWLTFEIAHHHQFFLRCFLGVEKIIRFL